MQSWCSMGASSHFYKQCMPSKQQKMACTCSSTTTTLHLLLKSNQPQQQLRNILPGTKASPQGSPQNPLAQLLGSAQLCTPLLPGVESGGQAFVPNPVGNGSAGLATVVELQPGLPGGGHCLVLQPGHNAQLDAACCTYLHLTRLQYSDIGCGGDLMCSRDRGSNARLSPTPLLALGPYSSIQGHSLHKKQS